MKMSRWLPWRLRMKVWWMLIHQLEMATRGVWIWVGHVGIGFRRIPRFGSRLMIKQGAQKGVRVFQFGPLVMSWEEAR